MNRSLKKFREIIKEYDKDCRYKPIVKELKEWARESFEVYSSSRVESPQEQRLCKIPFSVKERRQRLALCEHIKEFSYECIYKNLNLKEFDPIIFETNEAPIDYIKEHRIYLYVLK